MPTLMAKDLKEFIRKKAKEAPFPMTSVKIIVATLEGNQPSTVTESEDK